jgi:hypothetical protein
LSESKDVTGFFVGILGTPTSLFSIWTTSPIEGRVLGSGCEHKRPTSNMVLISCMSYAHSNLDSIKQNITHRTQNTEKDFVFVREPS